MADDFGFDIAQRPSGQATASSDIESSMDYNRANVGREGCRNASACEALTDKKLCRRCALAKLMSDPSFNQRRLERLAQKVKTAEYRANQSAAGKAREAAKSVDPAWREARRQQGLTHGIKNLRAGLEPEVRKIAAQKIRQANVPWCPPEFLDLNQKLKRNGLRLPERQAIIEEHVRWQKEAPSREARSQIERFTQAQIARAEREKAQTY